MTEMQPREGLRARQDALADVLEGLALGLADADHVTEHVHHAEGAIEHRGAVGIDRQIDALAAGEIEHRLLEILGRGVDDPRGPEASARFSLPAVPVVPITLRPACTASWVTIRPTPPPIALTSTVSPASADRGREQHVIGGEGLDRERRTDVERHAVRQLDQPGGAGDAFLGIAAALLGEGRDPVADLHAGDARPERDTVPETSKPSTIG